VLTVLFHLSVIDDQYCSKFLHSVLFRKLQRIGCILRLNNLSHLQFQEKITFVFMLKFGVRGIFRRKTWEPLAKPVVLQNNWIVVWHLCILLYDEL